MTINYFLLLRCASINDSQYERQKLGLVNLLPYDPENENIIIVQHNKVNTSFDFQRFIKTNNIQVDTIIDKLKEV